MVVRAAWAASVSENSVCDNRVVQIAGNTLPFFKRRELPRLVNQPRVLQRQRRLIGENIDQLQLICPERARRRIKQDDAAIRASFDQ